MERQTGRIKSLSYRYSSVEYAHGATEIFFNLRHVPQELAGRLQVGRVIHFDVRFNLKGPVAVNLQLAE